jgi:hypothetical protein
MFKVGSKINFHSNFNGERCAFCDTKAVDYAFNYDESDRLVDFAKVYDHNEAYVCYKCSLKIEPSLLFTP